MDKYQLKTRPVVIRRELLDHYSELGLDEQDLVILLKLIYASETSNKQPSIELLQKVQQCNRVMLLQSFRI